MAEQGKKTSLSTWIVAGVFALIIGSCITSKESARDDRAVKHEKTPEQIADAKKADEALNASLAALREIKKRSYNPKSFELNSFFIYPDGVTCYEYRATNAFNAVVPVKAVFDPSSNTVLFSSADKNKFVAAWNKGCTREGGKEHAGGLKHLSLF